MLRAVVKSVRRKRVCRKNRKLVMQATVHITVGGKTNYSTTINFSPTTPNFVLLPAKKSQKFHDHHAAICVKN